MTKSSETIAARIDARFGQRVTRVPSTCGELTYEVAKEDLVEVATALRDEADFGIDQLIDVCGVDYLTYGETEWKTEQCDRQRFQSRRRAQARHSRRK